MIKIKVTQDDIQAAKATFDSPNHLRSRSCPIAQALKRLTRKYVNVGFDACLYNGIMYNLPEKARKFVHNFDQSKEVKPFTFVLKDKAC
jgi:hypothetical protein